MQYYGLIIISVILFGFNFALNNEYRKIKGSSLKISMQYTLLGTCAGLAFMLILNGFKFEFTPFTLIISLLRSLVGIGFSFCAFKALGTINLSVYSLFSMLGGMMLPFLQGIAFYNEPLTVEVALCFIFICIALALTIKGGSASAKGIIYYAGIFVLNGMSGVISKVFASAPYEKTSVAGEAILAGICSLVLSGSIVLFFYIKDKRADKLGCGGANNIGCTVSTSCEECKKSFSPKHLILIAILIAFGSGALNKTANYILQYALGYVYASVQYPMVTGGTMIVSTILCFFGKNKPSKKEILSVIIAFVGVSLLFIIPMIRGEL